MLTDLKDMKLPDIVKLPGVVDLPLKVAGPFGQALKAEANGDHALAQTRLDKAIEQEQIINAA